MRGRSDDQPLDRRGSNIQAEEDAQRIAEMQATGTFADMPHISTLIEVEVERLLGKVAGGGAE